MGAGCCIDKLARYANAIPRSTNATFQYVAHAEFPAYKSDVNGFASECETRIAGNDDQPAQFCQVRQDVFGDPVTEMKGRTAIEGLSGRASVALVCEAPRNCCAVSMR